MLIHQAMNLLTDVNTVLYCTRSRSGVSGGRSRPTPSRVPSFHLSTDPCQNLNYFAPPVFVLLFSTLAASSICYREN